MQLHYLLVIVDVSDISDVKVMSSTVVTTVAITVVNNCNIRTKPCYLNCTLFKPNLSYFEKPN